jgi:hypothetical protein
MKLDQGIKLNIIKYVLVIGLFFLAIPNFFANTTLPHLLKLGDNLIQVKQLLSKQCETLIE